MIEEVEITDETLDSTELGNQELVHSEDLNAVLKQLPPEAFNELFSGTYIEMYIRGVPNSTGDMLPEGTEYGVHQIM